MCVFVTLRCNVACTQELKIIETILSLVGLSLGLILGVHSNVGKRNKASLWSKSASLNALRVALGILRFSIGSIVKSAVIAAHEYGGQHETL